MGTLDTLVTRTLLVSLVGITLVHVLSLWSYERALDRELAIAHEARIAEQLIAIKRSVMLVPAAQREPVAHDLSGGPIEAHWSPTRAAIAGGPGVLRWQGVAGQVRKLAPELAEADVVIGASSEADPHIALVSMRLPDDSWLNVSLFAAGGPRTSGHGTLLSTSLMALGVLGLSVLLARWLSQPLSAVAGAARALAPDGPPTAVAERGPREVRELAVAFNAMQRRISDLVARRTQALAAVSHDLRTPLTRLRLRVDGLADPDLRQAAAADIDEMEAMIEATLSYLRGEEAKEPRRALDLVALLASVVHEAADAGHNARLAAPPHLVVEGRLFGLKRAFANLVGNAVRFGREVVVTVDGAATLARISIEDDGPGIPPDQLEAVLEPFVRLEPSRSRDTGGVGLGLTIAKAAIEADGGSLSLDNRPEGGLRAIVTLPQPAA